MTKFTRDAAKMPRSMHLQAQHALDGIRLRTRRGKIRCQYRNFDQFSARKTDGFFIEKLTVIGSIFYSSPKLFTISTGFSTGLTANIFGRFAVFCHFIPVPPNQVLYSVKAADIVDITLFPCFRPNAKQTKLQMQGAQCCPAFFHRIRRAAVRLQASSHRR